MERFFSQNIVDFQPNLDISLLEGMAYTQPTVIIISVLQRNAYWIEKKNECLAIACWYDCSD
jgi:hypothetical protein